MKQQLTRVVLGGLCLFASSGTLLAQSAPPAGRSAIAVEEQGDPSKGSTDIDRTIAYPMAQVLDAARFALATYQCDAKKKEPDYLECTRRKEGFPPSGGETLKVQLRAQGKETRVEIQTVRSFRSPLAFRHKNWSTPIFDALVIALKQPLSLGHGIRVRVSAAGAARKPLIGNILTMDKTTLTIVNERGQRVKVPRELGTRLEISENRKNHALLGFVIGAAAGGLLGTLPEAADDFWIDYGYGLHFTRPQWVGFLGGVLGGSGAAVGYLVRTEKWLHMPLDQVRVGLQAAPSGQGGKLTLTFAF